MLQGKNAANEATDGCGEHITPDVVAPKVHRSYVSSADLPSDSLSCVGIVEPSKHEQSIFAELYTSRLMQSFCFYRVQYSIFRCLYLETLIGTPTSELCLTS